MSDGKNHYGGAIAIAVGVLLAIYLLFPVMCIVPLTVAEKHHWISHPLAGQIVDVIFAPATLLGDRFPVYERMLEAEARFCVQHGMAPYPH